MAPIQCSLEQARRISIASQCLGAPLSSADGDDLRAIIGQLGYVQIDTIAIVERAHHHTLWNRASAYAPDALHELHVKDKAVFEYWAHAMAYLPIEDYRYYMPRMQRQRTAPRDGLKQWMQEHADVLTHVLERIRAEGPLTSKDFDPPPGIKRGTWWNWKPAKRALEILFWQGFLMIPERRSFQKVYDLTERVLPPVVDTTMPSQGELSEFHVRRALHAMGVARIREMRDVFQIVPQAELASTVRNLTDAGEVALVALEGQSEPYYALASMLEREPPETPERAWILSPFDNLIIHRDRVKRLFGFDYTIECYLPAAKRTYGYFVLPVLWRNRLFARLDPKADRQQRTLIVKALWFEPWFTAFDEGLPALANALASYARFNGCDNIQVCKMSPTGHKRRFNTLLRQVFAV